MPGSEMENTTSDTGEDGKRKQKRNRSISSFDCLRSDLKHSSVPFLVFLEIIAQAKKDVNFSGINFAVV